MPQVSIHWKGCPHRHLPRIRVASPQYGAVGARRYAHVAALEASQLPYSLALQKARLQHRITIRRRKHISHRLIGGTVASRRSSQRAISHIRLSGVDSPPGELEAPIYKNRLSESPVLFSGDLSGSAETFGNPSLMPDRRDSSTPSIFDSELAKIVDLKPPAKNKRQRSTVSQGASGQHDQGVSTNRIHKNSVHRRASVFGKTRNYDPTLPVGRTRRPTKPTSTKYDITSEPQSIRMILKPATTGKQLKSTNLSIQQATRSNVSTTSTASSPEPAQLFGLPSRTPAQLLALKKFSRGLEQHLIAQEAVRKACLSLSSLSTSTLSADTVVEFVPYTAEFQAAGLAVTSAEQRRCALRQSRRELIPMPPKEAGDKEQTPANATEGMSNGSPIASHDGSNGGPYTDTASSRTTLIAFSNCREPSSIAAYPVRTIPIKKAVLPWLRRAREPSSLSESIPPNGLTANNNMGSSSESTCESCATTIIEFSSYPFESKKKEIGPDPPPIVLRPIDFRDANTVDDSFQGKNKEIVPPIVSERPVLALAGPQNDGTNCGKISGNRTFPLDLSPKSDQRTRATLANPGSSKKKEIKTADDAISQSHGRTFLIEPPPTSGISIGSFRASPKLLAQQRPLHVEHPERVNVLNNAPAYTQQTSLHLSSKPPSHAPPSPPRNNCALVSKLDQLANNSILDQYDFDSPSIYEQALNDVVDSAHATHEYFANDEKVCLNLPTSSSVQQDSLDPVKRRSAAYKPPKLSSHASTAATVSSLEVPTTDETQKKSSTDYSDIHDKDVFKGLQIALAAACNKDLDLWIMKMSGCRVRRFLADLRAFEGLGVNTLADQAKRTAKKRMEERDQRMSGHRYGHLQDQEIAPIEHVSKDKGEKSRSMKTEDSGRRGLLIAQMLGKREIRADETVRERALAMGWRNRSVSAGV